MFYHFNGLILLLVRWTVAYKGNATFVETYEYNYDAINKFDHDYTEPYNEFEHWGQFENQTDLVDSLFLTGFITNKVIKGLAYDMDRKYYVDKYPYDIFPVNAGFGASFCPFHMQAFALEKLLGHLKENSTVLDVGCGTGYLTTFMALFINNTGYVVGIDHIPQMLRNATRILKKRHPLLAEQQRIRFIEGDGRLGVPEQGPYDAIHVGAVCKDGTIPKALIEQLKPGGRMVIPLNILAYEELTLVDKLMNGTLNITKDTGDFSANRYLIREYLTDKEKQLKTEYRPIPPD